MPADNSTSFDYTNRLGIKKMPPGYLLIGLESGHFIWEREIDGEQSAIHWNKWAIWRSAWHDYVRQADAQPAECGHKRGMWNLHGGGHCSDCGAAIGTSAQPAEVKS